MAAPYFYSKNPQKQHQSYYPQQVQQSQQFIYHAPRDHTFTEFIDRILDEYADVSKNNRESILDKEGISYYYTAFTSPSYSKDSNYEFMETLGDSTLNKAIIWYFARRFPQINSPDGIDILTRLKIKFIQKKSFSFLAGKLNFWPFISTNFNRSLNEEMIKTLEDVFEAFFGTTELIIDKKFSIGTGYKICYKIISRLLDKLDININYESLVDSKTRLKELFDHNKHKGIGTLEYLKQAETVGAEKLYKSSIKRTIDTGETFIVGRGEGYKMEDAEQNAATNALETLKTQGFVKIIPDEYIKYCT
jgi:dsRNA-specific ribonuclease